MGFQIGIGISLTRGEGVGVCPDASLILGAEKVVNGSPTINTSGWSALNGATLSVTANGLKILSSGSASTTGYQALTLTPGTTYRLTYRFTKSTVNMVVLIWNDAFTDIAPQATSTADGTVTTYFKATTATTYLLFQTVGTTSGSYVEVTGVSVKDMASIAPVRCLWGEGDSYMAGAYGVVLGATVAQVTQRVLTNTAAGGSTIENIRDRIIANPLLRNRVLIVWDGSENGYVSATDYCDKLNTALVSLGHTHFVLIPAAVPYGMPTTNPVAIRDAMISRWPSNVLDWRDWVPNTAGVMNANTVGGDAYHLNQYAMDFMAAGISQFIAGW